MSRRLRPLPRMRSTDISELITRLIARRDKLAAAHRSTAVVERELHLAVCRQIRKEVREQEDRQGRTSS